MGITAIRGSELHNAFRGKVYTDDQWNNACNLVSDIDNAIYYGAAPDRILDLVARYQAIVDSLKKKNQS